MVHISELEWSRVEKVEDVVKPGDPIRVKLIKVDDLGPYIIDNSTSIKTFEDKWKSIDH